ncbi:MAG: hypothetical protein P3B98_07570, partial [Gemmatimonadota bacterium]|nr:hypothetical protein [Gemmatimonadota bacterium]
MITWDEHDVESKIRQHAEGQIQLGSAGASLEVPQHGEAYAQASCRRILASELLCAGESHNVSDV